MKSLIWSALLALTVTAAMAGRALAGSEEVLVEDPWARASIGTSRPGAAYMTVRNRGDEPVVLTGLATDLAMMAEIHRSSTNDQGVSTMAPAGEIEIAPGEAVKLAPGGLHAMLMKLKRPMVEGESFTLILRFDDGGEVAVEVPILGIAARGPRG